MCGWCCGLTSTDKTPTKSDKEKETGGGSDGKSGEDPIETVGIGILSFCTRHLRRGDEATKLSNIKTTWVLSETIATL